MSIPITPMPYRGAHGDQKLSTKISKFSQTQRQVSLVAISEFASVSASMGLPVAVTFAILDRGGSASQVGLVLAGASFTFIIFLLIGGVVADRRSRKLVAMASDLTRTIISVLIAAVIVFASAKETELIVLAVLWGAARGFFTPSITALIPEVVPSDSLQKANAFRSMAIALGQTAGPAITAVIMASYSAAAATIFTAFLYLISAIALSLIHANPKASLSKGAHPLTDLFEGVRVVRERKWAALTILSYSAMHLVAFGPILVLGPIIAQNHLGGVKAWGFLLGAQGVGGLLGSIAGFKIRPKYPMRFIAIMTAFAAAFPLCLALGANLIILGLASILEGIIFSAFEVIWSTLLQSSIPREALARVTSLDWMGSTATLPLGELLASPESRIFGVPGTLFVAAAAIAVGNLGLLTARSIRSVRQP